MDSRPPTTLEKLLLAGRLAISRPGELLSRIGAVLDQAVDRRRGRPDPPPAPEWMTVVESLGAAFGIDPWPLMRSKELAAVDRLVASRLAELASPFHSMHNADRALAHLAYLATRLVRPDLAVETGVANGVTSTYLLAGLEHNGKGRLLSVDLPPLAANADESVGRIVPDALRSSWTLERGVARRVLKRLLGGQPPVGVFVHDSLFTTHNTTRELQLVTAARSSKAIFVVNCSDASRAFDRWQADVRPALTRVVRADQKDEQIGIAAFTV